MRSAAPTFRSAPADPSSGGGGPKPIRAPALPPAPLHTLPDVLGRYVGAMAAARCVDPAMPLTFLLGIAASAIGRAVEIELRHDWREIAPLWLGHVAAPGKQKSPTLKAIAAPLFEADNELDAEHAAALEEWNIACELAAASKPKKPQPERPVRRQLVVSDTTIEALADVLAASPRVCALHDELGALFDGMGAYKKNGGHDRQSWLSLHQGARITVNRKGKDPLIVESPRLGIVGATTPATAARVLGVLQGDGMVDRFFLTSSAPTPNRFKTPPVPEELKEAWAGAVKHLCTLRTEPPRVLGLSESASERFGAYFEPIDSEAAHPALQGVMGKLAGHVGRIALTLALLHDPYTAEVSEAVMVDAIELGGWFLAHTIAIRTSAAGGVLLSPKAGAAHRWLKGQGGRAFLRDVARSRPGGIASTEEAENACNELVAAELAYWQETNTTAGNSRAEIVLCPTLDS